ncbi:hypothetical protein MLD38_011508 [Melastoma candidum]|uniref:Uncharacterized protein n=1 Tax=Melastoma candidum TaxID=119954 RepID=A0ACB9R2W7_9MYRT|nr:hypothetical protein MLD38_011508 [Melastoma candidum]
MAASSGGGVGSEDEISLSVKFGRRSIPLTMSRSSTVRELKSLLQPLTDVLPRGQKLIFKGKVLADAALLQASGLTNGAKVMLVASQGLHQGEGPVSKPALAHPVRRANIDGRGQAKNVKGVVSVEKSRSDRWKITGVVALAECNLKAIPEEVWACGSSARILDISSNFIESMPQQISSLTSLQKLLMSANGMSEQSVSWEGVSSLKLLTVLSLNQNQFKSLPSAVTALRPLRQLDISRNQLTALPVEIGHLKQLEVLKANNNRISTIPSSIGDCDSLIEVDFSSNLLSELPETLGNLHKLKVLVLGNNGLISLPSTLFRGCIQLSTLDLHNTEITTDILRRIEGWESFEERRQSKHQKQLDFRVASSAEFDESADKS